MLCVGDGTGSPGNVGDWGLCGEGAGSAVHRAPAPLFLSLHSDSQAQTTPWGWQEQVLGGPICFWAQSQWLQAQGGQGKAVLNPGSSAGVHRMH